MIAQDPEARTPSFAVLIGIMLGMLAAWPAIGAAVVSAGAGHGDYVAARALFPVPMLLARVEGSIGLFSVAAAIVQFPLYGGLLGGFLRGRACAAAMLTASLHIGAAIVCFAGASPDFS